MVALVVVVGVVIVVIVVDDDMATLPFLTLDIRKPSSPALLGCYVRSF